MSETTQQAVTGGSSYEVLKSRLAQQGSQLKDTSHQLNQRRVDVFGGQDLSLIGKVNVQTSAKCVPVDMAQVDSQLLFGFEVSVGLKAQPSLSDVFGLYQFHETDGVFRMEPQSVEESFLADPRFLREFTELFTYYQDARLSQISRQETLLYIAFQIGMRAEDRKVFRFQINKHSIEYSDSQGHQSLESSVQHDFDWIETGREDHVLGDHPHVSICDRIFVECVGGDLTIKVEDHTKDGKGIYQELVEDPHQSVADAKIDYAFIGDLIVLRVLPNREKAYRYFIYNPLNQTVTRADAMLVSAKALPEDHGILYSHGYVLSNGESKAFDIDWENLKFFQKVTSPNGEDVLYFFFDMVKGYYVAYTYNMIEKQFSAPMESHGFSLYPDGRMLVFELFENADASTIHPLRVWDTPFSTMEYYSAYCEKTDTSSPLFNLGNAEVVRALSSILSICHLASTEEVTQAAYETLLKQCQTTLDHYHWLNQEYAIGLGALIQAVMSTADSIIDEFAKVQNLQLEATKAVEEETNKVNALVGRVKLAAKDQAAGLLTLLSEVKVQVGSAMTLKQQHYVDVDRVEALVAELNEQRDYLNRQLLELLQNEKAYQPFKKQLQSIEEQLPTIEKASDIQALQQQIEKLRGELQLVTEEVTEIETDDPTQSTRILDLTTEVSSMLNATSAQLKNTLNGLRSGEAKAEFGAQFKLLAQSVSSAMEQAKTPDDCDVQLAKLIGQLEKLESRFVDFDEFLVEIYSKRDEIQSTLESHKQQLVSAQQRRVQNLLQASKVTFSSIEKRVARFDDVAQLNSYFATDAMVLKLRQLSESIRDLGDAVKADSVDAKLKSIQDQSLRALRDNQDIFEEGGRVLRLGKHRFSVNKQALDITLIEHDGKLCEHISGTDFYQPVEDQDFAELQKLSRLDVPSETDNIYRSEYLAYLILSHALKASDGLSLKVLDDAVDNGQLINLVQRFAAPRFKEGYVKGIHDHDAERILRQLVPIFEQAGSLRFGQQERAMAWLWLSEQSDGDLAGWAAKAKNAHLLKVHLHSHEAYQALQDCLASELAQYGDGLVSKASDYLIQCLSREEQHIETSRDAMELCEDYLQYRRSLGWSAAQRHSREAMQDHLQWLTAYARQQSNGEAFVVEAAAIAAWQEHARWPLRPIEFTLTCQVEDLFGEHRRIESGCLNLVLDDFLLRGEQHRIDVLPKYEAYLQRRAELLSHAKEGYRLDEFKPRPLTAFVRNKLISDSYLPLIGDNFAKQMGTVGANKRSDLMGMLLLISPPGYGKTTLIEYVAHKLGLVFMKINGPSIGHQATSLDPKDAPDQNAAREIEKINLAFEMGNNVLLYLDDIQHTTRVSTKVHLSL